MRNKKLFFLCLAIFVSLSSMVSIANRRTRFIFFDVNKELNRDSITKRSSEFTNTRNEIRYLNKMYSIADKKDSFALQEFILSNMIRNYYNRFYVDSIEYWFRKLEPIAVENKLYREFFYSYSLLCSAKIYELRYDEAIEEANKLYLYAKELNNSDGLIASYENSGIIYLETNRYVEAIKAFDEGLGLLKRESKRRYGYEFQLNTYKIESYLKLRDYPEVGESIDEANQVLQEWKGKAKNVPYDRCAWLLDCFYITMYTDLKQPEDAAKYVESAKQYVSKVNDDYVRYYYYYTCASYYRLIKNYDEAIHKVDKILSEVTYPPALNLKGKILLESGRYKEAAIAYNIALNDMDSIYTETLSKQVNQLRTIHEVDKLEIKNKELEIESRTFKLNVAIILSLILLGFSIASVLYILRIRRIRNRLRESDKILKEDKMLLLESEKALIIEKEKVEKSSKFKDLFLANMSHEVRTPLNAIVGFSGVLTEMYKDEETLEYVNIIKHNTDHLLKLINDTVDASSLQAGLLPFNYEEVELDSTLLSLVEEMKDRVSDGVALHFCPDNVDGFKLNTDILRLSQLLRNLLLNSIKFTEAGDIFLKYNVDEESNEVIFTVEDTGKGIPEEMQNVIFESFKKVDEFNQGLGLGLTLVKLIAIKLGGSVRIDPSYKTGTKIIFIHPIN